MKKRVISLLLALVLALGLLPTAAWAAGTTFDEYFKAAGMPAMAENYTGYKKWKVVTKDGEVLQSSSLNRGNCYFTLTFSEDTSLSFKYKVSSGSDYNYFYLSKNDQELTSTGNQFGNNVDWTSYTLDVQKNDVLKFGYKKTASYVANELDDCVYLRNFTCGTPIAVTLHANNGTGETSTQNIYGGKGALTANRFITPNKVFAGWATEVDGEVVYPDGAEITAKNNIDLYAVWGDAYTVTFDYNDGNTGNATVDVAQNTAIDAAKMPKDPAKKGYTFEGWFHGETKLMAETTITANVTYTAKWTPISYTIALNPGDGDGEPVNLDAVYDQYVTLPQNTFTYDGYGFAGWSTSRGSSYGSIEDGATIRNKATINGATYNLYATWKGKEVTVTVDPNYKGAATTDRTGAVGSNYNHIFKTDGGPQYSELKSPVRTGYIFDGWYDAAEGGSKISPQYKFTAEDAKNGKTLYAHWIEAVTITFDANGGSCSPTTKDIKKGTAYGSLPTASLSGKAFDGWYTAKDGGTKVGNDTIFNEDTTLYARYRNYQITVSFNANSGTGEMDKLVCESQVAQKLPKCTFTRDGYDFTGWSTASYSSTVSYADEAEYTYPYTAYRDTTTTLYAVWKANISKTAIDAIDKAIRSDNIIRAETTLPTSGEGYTISYSSSNTELLSNSGIVVLPASGSATVTLTATITDTKTSKTYTKEYILTLYSAEATQTETDLKTAADKLGSGTVTFSYDAGRNAITVLEKKLIAAKCEGVVVSVKEKTEDSGHYSGIEKDGTINYYFNPSMSGSGSYFYMTFILSKNGASVEKRLYIHLDWDKAKVREALNTAADALTVPETAAADMKLPIRANGKTWTTVTWLSNDPALTVQSSSYSPYSVALNAKTDTTVMLTATVKCNSVNGVFVTREFECTVPGGTGTGTDYQAALEGALSDPGLRDFVTGEKLTADENGVYAVHNDIQFPTTRDLKIDGKYTPVVITSSDTAVIENPDVANAARVNIYRPLPGEAAKTVTLTVKLLDRPSGSGRDYANLPVLAEKSVIVSVQPLTQAEIDAEIALMAKVKAAYWDGIRNANAEKDNVTTDLHAFQECYLDTDGQLTWVYDRKDLKNHGIVPVPLDNWYDLQLWRLFRSSNADVIAHENLLVSRREESKAVTVTSYLSSETLGKYAEKYPQNADFQKLYKQPVTIDLVVTGTQYAQGVGNTVRKQAARYALSNRAMLTVDFTLTGSGMGFSETKLKYAEGSTAFDVFSDMLAKHGYTCKRRGSYIASITSDGGKTLEEFDEGKNSGWMYRVNGKLVDRYMSAQGLRNGDSIEIYFTSDWTREPGAGSWKPVTPVTKGETPTGANGSATKVETKPDGTVVETTTKPDGTTVETTAKPDGSFRAVEKRADGTTVETSAPAGGGITASVSVPKKVGSTRVDLPVSAPTGGMVAVLVHPDGTEEILKNSVMTDTGIAFRAEGTMQVRITDNAKHFEDTQKHWSKEAVAFVSSRELFNGVSGSEFAPDLPMTRGMVNTVLARLAGADTMGGASWYAKGTAWAVENGISDGTNPEQEVTREQLAAMLYRYADSPAVSGALRFDDARAVSDWAYAAVKWCAENGIMNGVGSNLAAPQGLARRGQVAAMLMRFLRATL